MIPILARAPLAAMLLLSTLAVGLLAGGAASCGASPGRITGEAAKAAHENDADAYPTSSNVARWAKEWVKGEWVVTFDKDPFVAPREAAWKNAFVRALAIGAGFTEGTAAFEQAASGLSGKVSLSFAVPDFATLPQLLPRMDEPPRAFAFVRIDGGDSFLRAVESPLSFPLELERLDALERLARWQGDALADVPGVAWAEPNLLSWPSQGNGAGNGTAGNGTAGNGTGAATGGYSPPPEFKHNSLMVEILKRVRADVAYEWAYNELKARKEEPARVRVAVLDTGVDFQHPDLKDSMFRNEKEIAGNGIDDDGNKHIDDIHGIDATVENSRDATVAPTPGPADLRGPGQACPEAIGDKDDDLTSNCGHGTHVAGIIAAKHGGNLTTLGICPTCEIISVRVSERCLQPDTAERGECVKPFEAYDLSKKWEVDGGIADVSQIRGLTYLFNLRSKASESTLVTNVVNMSLGKYFRSRAMAYVIRNLERLNIVVVAAAGNDNTDTPSYPAAYDSVVSVCATGTEYHRGVYGKAIFSNFGDWVDICAPGVDIYSTVPGKDSDGSGRFKEKSGTSQATPFVAGAVGYMLSILKNRYPNDLIVRRLKASARYKDLYSSDYNGLYRACYSGSQVCDHLLGTGYLDLAGAVKGEAQSPVNDENGRAVTSGCVVNSLASRRASYVPRSAFSSMPVVLALAYGALRLAGLFARRARGARRMPKGRAGA